MNKKKYTKADMEITWFDTEDFITTSGEGEGEGSEKEDNDEL